MTHVDFSTFGLSPRGRGNPMHPLSTLPVCGSIPARAGKPPSVVSYSLALRVYPRAGGETIDAPPPTLAPPGLSPRGRGNRGGGGGEVVHRGSIPARAGKPPGRMAGACAQRVYPRAGGETGWSTVAAGILWGLSPRGRGNRIHPAAHRNRSGSIPARAGKPCIITARWIWAGVYPRAGGETSSISARSTVTSGLSPRGRGNRLGVQGPTATGGSIPARAGKPGPSPAPSRAKKVYPRAGGETTAGLRMFEVGAGLSPRGRGNPASAQVRPTRRRSIPARAGKP